MPSGPVAQWHASGHMPSGHMPSGHMPSGHMPSGHMPSGHMPSGHMPSGHMPSGHMPSGHMPVQVASPSPHMQSPLSGDAGLERIQQAFLRAASSPGNLGSTVSPVSVAPGVDLKPEQPASPPTVCPIRIGLAAICPRRTRWLPSAAAHVEVHGT